MSVIAYKTRFSPLCLVCLPAARCRSHGDTRRMRRCHDVARTIVGGGGPPRPCPFVGASVGCPCTRAVAQIVETHDLPSEGRDGAVTSVRLVADLPHDLGHLGALERLQTLKTLLRAQILLVQLAVAARQPLVRSVQPRVLRLDVSQFLLHLLHRQPDVCHETTHVHVFGSVVPLRGSFRERFHGTRGDRFDFPRGWPVLLADVVGRPVLQPLPR